MHMPLCFAAGLAAPPAADEPEDVEAAMLLRTFLPWINPRSTLGRSLTMISTMMKKIMRTREMTQKAVWLLELLRLARGSWVNMIRLVQQ